jgi:hypothetical protein
LPIDPESIDRLLDFGATVTAPAMIATHPLCAGPLPRTCLLTRRLAFLLLDQLSAMGKKTLTGTCNRTMQLTRSREVSLLCSLEARVECPHMRKARTIAQQLRKKEDEE